jgi:hypothetical protein
MAMPARCQAVPSPDPRQRAGSVGAEVAVPLEQLQLLEGQDMALVRAGDLLAGSIWSTRLGTHRPRAHGPTGYWR